jgi:hypothetical protein
MRRCLIVLAAALLMVPLFMAQAEAQRRFGGGFRAGGLGAGPAFRGGFGGGFARAAIVRPGFAGGGVRWAGGFRGGLGPRWGWRRPGLAFAGLGLATGLALSSSYYGYDYGYAPVHAGYGYGYGYDPYAYGYGPYRYAGYDGCTVLRRVWTGWGYRVVLVNRCGYY